MMTPTQLEHVRAALMAAEECEKIIARVNRPNRRAEVLPVEPELRALIAKLRHALEFEERMKLQVWRDSYATASNPVVRCAA